MNDNKTKKDRAVILNSILKKAKSDKVKVKTIIELANHYYESGQYYLSKQWGDKLLEIAAGNDKIASHAYNIIGKAYIGLDLFDRAMEYMTEYLKISKSLKDDEHISKALNALGAIYSITGNEGKATEYLLESLEYKKDFLPTLTNLGVLYYRKHNYDEALEYEKNALEIATKNGNINIILFSKSVIASIYLGQKKFDKAIKKFKEIFNTTDEITDKHLVLIINLGLCKAYNSKGETDTAKEYLSKAISFIEQIKNDNNVRGSYMMISETYEEMNDYAKALEFYKMFCKLNSKLFNDKLAHNLAYIQDSLEKEKKEMSIKQKKITERMEKLQELYADVFGINKLGIFSDVMKKVYMFAVKLHNDRSMPVLIEGETGTGKEVFARVVHFGNGKNADPFICINCSAISPSLFESELFGYEGGAFTSSKQKGMPGKLELANGGTIFLDEIGDLPMEMQPKLLRVLEEKEMYRIGGINKIKLDVRIICATNRNLSELVEENLFRRDLYYRLNACQIKIPALRERKEEILPLAKMFLFDYAKQKKKSFVSISKEAENYLESQEWPGNVRELENVIERAVMLYDDKELRPQHLINEFSDYDKSWQKDDNIIIQLEKEKMPLVDIEATLIQQLLKKFNGNKTQTAEYLGITRMTLRSKIKKY